MLSFHVVLAKFFLFSIQVMHNSYDLYKLSYLLSVLHNQCRKKLLNIHIICYFSILTPFCWIAMRLCFFMNYKPNYKALFYLSDHFLLCTLYFLMIGIYKSHPNSENLALGTSEILKSLPILFWFQLFTAYLLNFVKYS